MIRLLHVGCGGDPLPPYFGDVDETRLDIDAGVEPHIVADMTDLGDIGEFDAIFSCHAIEHLTPANVAKALREFRRVLRPGGYAMVVVPDLEDVKPTNQVMYDSPAGPVTGRDMYYGFAGYVDRSPHMLHRTGFVRDTMHEALAAAGFSRVEAKRVEMYNLLGVGIK